jgi:hypothetical protein
VAVEQGDHGKTTVEVEGEEVVVDHLTLVEEEVQEDHETLVEEEAQEDH